MAMGIFFLASAARSDGARAAVAAARVVVRRKSRRVGSRFTNDSLNSVLFCRRLGRGRECYARINLNKRDLDAHASNDDRRFYSHERRKIPGTVRLAEVDLHPRRRLSDQNVLLQRA